MSQSRSEADSSIQGTCHVTSISVVRCRICSGRPRCTGKRSLVRTDRVDGYEVGPEGVAATEAGHSIDEAIDATEPASVETRPERREPGIEEPGNAAAPGRDNPAASRIDQAAGCATAGWRQEVR